MVIISDKEDRGELMKLFFKKLKYIRKNRRHAFIGLTFTSPGTTTAEPIFEVRLGKRFFRVYDFGGSTSSYGGFTQNNKAWLWQTSTASGQFYVWTTVLPKVINREAALNF